MKSSSPYNNFILSAISAGAFANEFFGLVKHTANVPVYQGDLKLFVDAVAVICAGTIASVHSINNKSNIESALLDSSVPIGLAYVAPSIFTESIVHTFRNVDEKWRFFVSFVAGLIFIAFLSSLEHVLSSFAKKRTTINNVIISAILLAVISALIVLRRVIGSVHTDGKSKFTKKQAIGGIIVLFAGAMAYNHPMLINKKGHHILASVLGVATLCIAIYGIKNRKSLKEVTI